MKTAQWLRILGPGRRHAMLSHKELNIVAFMSGTLPHAFAI